MARRSSWSRYVEDVIVPNLVTAVFRVSVFLLAVWVVTWAVKASAGSPLPFEPYWLKAHFSTTSPTAVTVDVVELATGTQVANDSAAVQLQEDSANVDSWKFNLATVTSYPTTCAVKGYMIQWIGDAADCIAAPASCVQQTVTVGGDACQAAIASQSPFYEYATGVLSLHGITQKVLDYHDRRGELPIKWQKVLIAGDHIFGTPGDTLWIVYFWTDANNRPRIKCTVPTFSDPAVSLPSSTHCVVS